MSKNKILLNDWFIKVNKIFDFEQIKLKIGCFIHCIFTSS
jgi:hypothetical protein